MLDSTRWLLRAVSCCGHARTSGMAPTAGIIRGLGGASRGCQKAVVLLQAMLSDPAFSSACRQASGVLRAFLNGRRRAAKGRPQPQAAKGGSCPGSCRRRYHLLLSRLCLARADAVLLEAPSMRRKLPQKLPYLAQAPCPTNSPSRAVSLSAAWLPVGTPPPLLTKA